MLRVGIEDTDRKAKIEIYGIEFEINNVTNLDKYEDIKDNDENGIKNIIEELIGKGAIETLNKKRKELGAGEIDNTIALNILMNIYEAYAEGYTDKILAPMDKMSNRIDNFNRKTRRYNNRRNRRYDRY